MTSVPFTKAQGAKNDFLLTWRDQAPAGGHAALARAICDRFTGVGADGWMLVDRQPAIELYNSDGSKPELSGNGTRCAAAFLREHGVAGTSLTIQTGAGAKHLEFLRRESQAYWFRMDMGEPVFEESATLEGHNVSILNVGNPQCVVMVDSFDFDWRRLGAALEGHPRFPNRTNVSFVRVVGPHAVEARFWERGAGETNSSGTGSTGAFFAAARLGLVHGPGRVETVAGPLEFSAGHGRLLLTGPAEIVAEGTYRYEKIALDDK